MAFSGGKNAYVGSELELSLSGLTAGTQSALYVGGISSKISLKIDGTEVNNSGSYFYWYPNSSTSTISITPLDDSKYDEHTTTLYAWSNNWKYIDSKAITIDYTKKAVEQKEPSITVPTSLDEGSSSTIQFNDFEKNKYYYYALSGIDSSDTSTALKSYFYVDTNGDGSLSFATVSDATTEGSETVTLSIYSDYNRSKLYKSATFNINDTSIDNLPLITTGTSLYDTSNPSSIDEGKSLYWEVKDLKASSTYYYKITGIDSQDVSYTSDSNNSLSGQFYNYYTSSTKNLYIKAKSDLTTEGPETIKFELFTDSSFLNSVGTVSTTLNDTSVTPIPEITGPSTLNEGGSGTFLAKNLKDQTYYYYRINDPTGKLNDDDLNSRYAKGTFHNSYSTSTQYIYIYPLADYETEGSETASLEIFDNASYSGAPIISKEFSISDTSVDNTKLTYGTSTLKNDPTSVGEGENIIFSLTSLSPTTYYWKFDGISSEDVKGNMSGQFKSYTNGYKNIPLNIIADDLTEGTENVSFILSKKQSYADPIKSVSFSILDTSLTPEPKVEITNSNIRSNEGESAEIALAITTFPVNTKDLYWKLSGAGLSKDDLATRFGDLSEPINLTANDLKTSKTVRGTLYRSGSYNLKIPFSADETTEGTETFQLQLYDNKSLSGTPLDSTFITIYDTSKNPPKSILNSATLNAKKINLYFSEPVNPSDVSPGYFKLASNNKNLPIESIKLNASNNSATISLKKEPETGSDVGITYTSPNKSILQSFKESISVDDLSKPIPIRGIAFTDYIELRFSEKLNTSNISKSSFEVRGSNRSKKISSVDLKAGAGIAIINLDKSIDINDEVEIDYYDLAGNQSSGVLEDTSGNDVATFKKFQVTNEASSTDDISVILAEADENVITLGFDIEIDEKSIPNNGMFRVSINGNKSKIKDINLSAKKREAYLELKNPITNGDSIKLTYIDAKGNQKDNIIQSKYGGDLGTFKDLFVENLSATSFDPPGIEDAYYDIEDLKITVEFDEIISSSKLKNSRFKVYSKSQGGKKNRHRVVDILSFEDDTIVEIILKKPIAPSTQELLFDYRDPKGDQKKGVLEDLQGNDLQSTKGFSVEM